MLLQHIRRIHEETHGAYGTDRVWRELNAQGIRCGRGQVIRLRRDAGLLIPSDRKRRSIRRQQSKPGPVAPRLFRSPFKITEPNRVWLGDTTFVRTRTGYLHLAILLDFYSRRVVGWGMDGPTATHKLVMSALGMALMQRNPSPGLIHHTDRGGLYISGTYQKCLRANGIVPSMSRSGSPWQNMPVERFFGALKQELVYDSDFRSVVEAQQAIFEYIELFYNRRRRHSALGWISPQEFEERNGFAPFAI